MSDLWQTIGNGVIGRVVANGRYCRFEITILEAMGQMTGVGVTGLGAGGCIGRRVGEEEKRGGNRGESPGNSPSKRLGGQKRPVLRDGMRA